MPRKCSVPGCRSNYDHSKKQESEPIATFSFPLKNSGLLEKWVQFVNREEWEPTAYSAICIKHFEKKYYTTGKKTKLLYETNPIPTIGHVPTLEVEESMLETSEKIMR